MLIKKFITFLLRELASTEMVIRTKYHFRCTFFAHIFHSSVLFANFYASVHSEFSVEWTALSPISLKSIQFSKTFEIQKKYKRQMLCIFNFTNVFAEQKSHWRCFARDKIIRFGDSVSLIYLVLSDCFTVCCQFRIKYGKQFHFTLRIKSQLLWYLLFFAQWQTRNKFTTKDVDRKMESIHSQLVKYCRKICLHA